MESASVEEKAENLLLQLVKIGDGFVSINFISRQEARGQESKSFIEYGDRHVRLSLVEPLCPADLDAWVELIISVEERINLLEKERAHDYTNPNFFKRIRAKVRDGKAEK